MTQSPFDIVTKNPQEPHIPYDVHPSGMHEDGSEHRDKCVTEESSAETVIGNHMQRNQAVLPEKILESRPERNFVHPHK
jgi:hypothetical protein